MKSVLRLGVIFSLAASALSGAFAADLAPGMKAPSLKFSEWIKGTEVKAFKPGNVYVVEFWATWCGPCIEGMPHLSELQAKFKDKVTVIGVNAFERPDEKDISAKVKKFVEGQGSKMAYTVARDTTEGDMAKNWMTAANQNGIPCAFIVDQKGEVVWIGHPAMMDEPLSQVVEGTFDLEQSKKDFAAQMEATEKRMALSKRLAELNALYKEGKKDEAEKGFDEFIKANPGMKPAVDNARLNLYFADDFPKAEKIIREQMASAQGNALNMSLFSFAQRPLMVKEEDKAAAEKLQGDVIAHILKSVPENDAFVRLAMVRPLVRLGKVKDAVALAELALKNFDADPKKEEANRKAFEDALKEAQAADKED